MEKRRDIEQVGDWELFSTMLGEFGHRRTMELAGWAVYWGMTGQIDNLKSMREELQQRGLSQRAVYRALADFRWLREHLEAKEGREVSNAELLRRIGLPLPYVANTLV